MNTALSLSLGTTLAPLRAMNGDTIPAGVVVRYASLGDGWVGVRVPNGAAAKVRRESIARYIGPVAVDPVDAIFALGELPSNDGARPVRRASAERPLTNHQFEGSDTFAGEATVRGARTADELCAAAGLGWRVASERFTTASGAASGNLRAIVREDTREVLDVMSEGFELLQPAESFAPLGALVDAGATFRGAGSFRGGRTIWAQVDLGTHDVVKGDAVAFFAHVRDTYDGRHAWSLQVGSQRIVCANTLLHACESGGFLGHSRHNKDLRSNVDEARRVLAELQGAAAERVAQYRRLAAWRITDDEVKALLGAVLPRPQGEDEKRREATRARQEGEVWTLLHGAGKGLTWDEVVGTGWAALNAVTEWADHRLAPSRGAEVVTVARRVTEGNAARVKSAAFGWLLAHAPRA